MFRGKYDAISLSIKSSEQYEYLTRIFHGNYKYLHNAET
jgi:hypothetical protein